MDPRGARARGLRRVTRLTIWLGGGAVVTTGAVAAVLAHPHFPAPVG